MESLNPSTDERRFLPLLGGLLGLGFVLRIFYVYAQTRSDPWFAFPMADAAVYLDWARDRLAGLAPPRDAYDQPPLYAWFLTAFLRLFGEQLGLLYYLQHLMMVAAAGLVGLTMRRRVGATAGLASCALFLFYGPHLFFASRLLGEPLALLLLCLALYLWTSSEGKGGAATTGLIAGLAAVARPNLALCGPLWAAAAARGLPARAVLLCIGLALALVPSTLRNYFVSGHLIPVSSNAGLTLYHGNGPGATGFITLTPELALEGKGGQRRLATRIASERSGRELDPVEADRWWGAQAVRERLDDPVGSAILLVRRIGLLLWSKELTLDGGPRQDPNPMRWSAPLPFALIFGLAAAGVAASGWRRTGGWPVWSSVLACLAAPLVFYVSSRYRLPLASMLCLPAGAGFAALVQGATPARRRRVGALVLIAAAAASWWMPGGAEVLAQADSAGYLQRGLAWRHAGQPERAVEDHRRAVALQPRWATALYTLAEQLEQLGRGAEAEQYFLQALAVDPQHANAACFFSQYLARSGRPDEALYFATRGLESHPQHEVCWNYLVAALMLQGRVSEAEQGIEEAARAGVEIQPSLAEQVRNAPREATPEEDEP